MIVFIVGLIIGFVSVFVLGFLIPIIADLYYQKVRINELRREAKLRIGSVMHERMT